MRADGIEVGIQPSEIKAYIKTWLALEGDFTTDGVDGYKVVRDLERDVWTFYPVSNEKSGRPKRRGPVKTYSVEIVIREYP